MPYKRITLPFAYEALEPFMDAETVKVHYEGHHKGYETKLNAAIEGKNLTKDYPTLIDLMKNYQNVEDPAIRVSIREFGGGLINHNFLWESLKLNTQIDHDSELYKEIIKTWGTFDKFKEEFLSDVLTLFGSGWVWLVKRKNGGLKIIKTFNQDNPWFLGFTPIIGIDLWEHSYYLKHRGNRAAYLADFWNVVNWKFAEEQYLK